MSLVWPQPLTPLGSVALSAAAAATPLVVVLLLMGVLRKSGLIASAFGLATALVLALAVWRMPPALAGWSIAFGFLYAAWSILWLVFCGLWLYHLSEATGSFDLLRKWVEQSACGDACVQAMLVAFCFGSLLEGSAGFGAPVAVTALLLVKLGFEPRKAVTVALLANTAPVAFGAVGVPIVALAGVTGIDVMKHSAAIGRQLPFISFILPAYLALVVGGSVQRLRRSYGCRRWSQAEHSRCSAGAGLQPVGAIRNRSAQLARVHRRARWLASPHQPVTQRESGFRRRQRRLSGKAGRSAGC